MSFFQDFATAYVANTNPMLYKQRMEEYERERQKLESNILAKTMTESLFGRSPTGNKSAVSTFNDIKQQMSNSAPAATPNYGNRVDGTPKGNGFLGPIMRPDGSVMTELSVGTNLNGKDMEIPLIVPTLTQKELEYLKTVGKDSAIPDSIMDKAAEHALNRLSKGLSPFADANDYLQSQQQAQPVQQSLASKFLPSPVEGGAGVLGNDMDPTRRSYLEALKSAFQSGDPQLMQYALDNLSKMQESHMRDIERTPLLRNLADTNLEVGSPEYSNAIIESIKKGGININFGDNKPLTLEQASSLVDSKGDRVKPPAGADWGWVRNYPGGLSWSKQPTAEESGKRAQTQTAIQMANDLKKAIDSGANIDSFWGALQKFRASDDNALNIATTAILDKLNIGNNPKDVNAFALTESLSNSVLQAFRGAAVGVEEQDKFNKQLPRPGMPKDLLKQNLELTIKNLQYLEQRREAISRGKQVPDYPSWIKTGTTGTDVSKPTAPAQPNIGLPEGFQWDSDETE